MQINLAVEQNKIITGPRVRRISPVGKEKVYEGIEGYAKKLCRKFKSSRFSTHSHYRSCCCNRAIYV